MKPRAFAALFLMLPVFALMDVQQSAITRGTWTVNYACEKQVNVQADFRTAHGEHSNSMEIDRAAIMPAQGQNAVQFVINRAAGTFNFSGVLVGKEGSGQVQFTPNPQFGQDMAPLGY